MRVALLLEPGVEAVASLLAVLKAGGAYVPLDPASPPERLAWTLADSGARLLLTEPGLARRIPEPGVEVVVLDREHDDADGAVVVAGCPLSPVPYPLNLAYVIYTSGSTGRPKGVLVEHRGVCNSVEAFTRVYGIGAGSRVLLFAPLHFDASVLDVFTALCSGATLVLASRDELMPGEGLVELLRRERVTHLKITPSALAVTPPAELPELEAVMVGGETCGAELVASWAPSRRFFNGYGATEHSVRCTAQPCTNATRPPPLGQPIANARLYVLDAGLAPVPEGVAGEAYMAGVGVARGYLGRPELTAERFVPDPYSDEPGARMYRSGDRVRRRADGSPEFLGRVDFQVKVRGFRIEPGEVEAALLRHPGVRDAVVVARADGAGEARLVGYAVPAEPGAAPSAGALRAHLSASLPEYMVPAALVVLPELPLTPNGKVDRRALPAPEPASGEEYAAPRTPTEEVLAGIWAQVLGVERVGRDAGFFALGGHSLLATRVVSRLREALRVEVPLRALFEAPTVAGLAGRIDALLREGAGTDAPPLVPVPRDRPLPLSFAQQRLWFLDRLEPGSTAYNVPRALRLRGALDAGVLGRVLAEIVRRHEALRTVFGEVAGEPVQSVHAAGAAPLAVVDLAGLPEGGREAEARRWVEEEARRPFDLERGPLLRTALLRLGAEEHVLVLSMHHIVSDGWSVGVLFGELATLYEAFGRGEASPLPELEVQYADFAAWQRGWLTGEVLERQLAWWRERLEGAPAVLEIPTDHPRRAVPGDRGAGVFRTLAPEHAERLRALARSEGATLYMVLLAVLDVLLARWSGQEDVVVGTPIANRNRRETEGLIGFFVNTLALRTDVSGDPTFRELLGRVRETTLGAYQHQDVPFEKLVEELDVERSLSHTPLFQVIFLVEEDSGGSQPFRGIEAEPYFADHEVVKFDLGISAVGGADGLGLGIAYRAELWDESTMERLLDAFALLLESVAADPGRRVLELPLMAPQERQLLVEEWSGGRGQAPSDRTVHEIFAEQAARTPAAIALTFGSESVTYAELDRRSDALARHLAALGLGPETRVGICVERSPEMVVGLLGILKAGGAYVPLDPAYPAERLAFMLADAGARVLLTQERLRGRLPEFGGEILLVDGALTPRMLGEEEGEAAPSRANEFAATTAQSPPSRTNGNDLRALAVLPSPLVGEGPGVGGARVAPKPTVPVSPESLAYVIYTSGSTGTPKGTEVPHRAIPGFFRGADYARFDEGTVTLQHSSTSWDALTLELWPALLSGGRCVLLPAQASEPALLGEQVRAHGADTLWLTAAYFNLIVDTTPEVLTGVAQVMIGGEAVSAPHVRRALELHPGLRIVNGYGPSECTVFASCWPVPAGFEGDVVPIGSPVGDRRVYLLDRGLVPVPVGVPGELFVGGPAVARGYLGRPELTAERFVPDPFGEPGARLYRSGDRARWRADGVLEFVGRTDFQVKVRGFRVEPGEVEGVLAAHPQVREAAVVARDGSLVGYVVGTATSGELREHLRASLPEYMVPTLFVGLDALPLTPNGKVDRRALPDPERTPDEERYVAPRTPAEEVVAGIFAGVLGVGRVGAGDDFFDLGGHSLLATRVAARVRETFGVELPLRTLFEAPTVAGLAARVDALLWDGGGTQVPPVVPVPRDRPLPLSFAQQRLWFVEQVEPGTSAYAIPVPMRLRDPVDAGVLGRALDEVVRRHEALRTVFARLDGEPVQVVRQAPRGVLAEVDLAALPAEAAAREVQRLTDAESLRPFDLERGPLFRAVLVRVAPDDAALLLSMHHIVSDGWSMGVLTRELSVLYGAFSRGEPSPLPELPFQYADFAAWQRGWLSGETLERQLAWWKAQLAGAPPLLELPTDRPRTAVRDARGGVRLFSLPADTSRALRELSRREGATLFMTLLAAWQLLLARHAGQEDVVVGSPIAGRTHLELEGLIGFFVNTLALRTDLSGDPTFAELLRRVRETTLGAYQHQDVPFERLVEELEVPRSLTHSPLFQAVLSLQNVERMEERLGEARVEPLERGTLAVRFDLTLALMEEGEEIHGALTYRAELWDGETTGRMLDHLRRLLEGIAADPDRRLSALPLLAPADRERVLHAPNATAAPFSAGACLHELIEAQARRAPDAPAAACGGRTLTYAELDRRASALARGLRARGVGPEARVALLLEPGLETVVALLGVLKAGGAYVPLDTGSPAERLAWTLADSGARLVLTQAELADRVPEGGAEVVVLDWERGGADGEAAVAGYPLSPVPCPLNLAYVIYTSGSTGRPKGVLVPHRGVVNSTEAYARVYGIGPGSRVLLFAPLHFDASVLDVFTALCSGATLVLASRDELMPGEGLTGLLRRERVTHLKITPSALAVTPPAELPDLEAVMVGGETCGAELVASWAPGRRFFNGYGATEHSVRCTAQLCTDATRPPPVGRPIANARLYVLDAGLEPVPTGVAGEVYMAGVGVTRGYLNRAELTAERFVPDPHSGEPGARMYRSGDRGRWLADGTLEFVGRVDFQLKVRGYRIEPGEVEAALLEHPALGDAVVVARGDRAEERYLAAYAVPREGMAAPDAAALRTHLQSHLPEHLVPSAIVLLDRLPLTSNGKIDRRALPAPEPASGEGYAAPRTPTEEVLAGIWAQVLGVERVGRDAGFFALGGHSLLATRVVSRLREAFRVEVPLRALFEAPTVAGLAGRIDALLREGAGTDAPPLVPVPRDRPLPLSFAQQRLWFLDRLEPGSTAYNVPRALRLRGALDAGVLGRVLAEIVRRHEALRTDFGEVAGEPVQSVHAAGAAPLAVVDLAGLAEGGREARGSPLGGGGGAAAVRPGAGAATADGAAAAGSGGARAGAVDAPHRQRRVEHGRALRGARHAVRGVRAGRGVAAAGAGGAVRGLRGVAARLADRGGAGAAARLVAGAAGRARPPCWRSRSTIPARRCRGIAEPASFRTLAPEHAEGLRSLARREGATLYMVLLAALDVLLARWSGQEDVVVGTPIANRNRRETEGLIGFFVNTLALRTDVSGNPGLPRAARARAGDDAGRLPAPGRAVRKAGGGAGRGALPEPHAALPGDVLGGGGPRRPAALPRDRGGAVLRRPRGDEVRPGDLRGGWCGWTWPGDLVPCRAVGRAHHGAPPRRLRPPPGERRGRSRPARPGAAAHGGRGADAAGGGVERRARPRPLRPPRPRAVRGAGGPHAARGRSDVRERVRHLRGAGPPLGHARAPPGRARRRPRDARRDLRGALAGDGGGSPRHPQGGRRLPPARPRLPRRAPGLHARRRGRASAAYAGAPARPAPGVRGRDPAGGWGPHPPAPSPNAGRGGGAFLGGRG